MTDEKHEIVDDIGPPGAVEDEGLAVDESPEGAAPVDEAPETAETVEAQAEDAAPEPDPLQEAERQRDEYLELAQRTQAEFENYRKRMAGELAAATERGKGELATGLISVLDNLERALEAAGVEAEAALDGAEVDGALEQGVVLTYRELCGALSRSGVEGLNPVGERFDPTWHEAIQSMPAEGQESGVVVQVLQKGYRLGDRVLRPARVIVSA